MATIHIVPSTRQTYSSTWLSTSSRHTTSLLSTSASEPATTAFNAIQRLQHRNEAETRQLNHCNLGRVALIFQLKKKRRYVFTADPPPNLPSSLQSRQGIVSLVTVPIAWCQSLVAETQRLYQSVLRLLVLYVRLGRRSQKRNRRQAVPSGLLPSPKPDIRNQEPQHRYNLWLSATKPWCNRNSHQGDNSRPRPQAVYSHRKVGRMISCGNMPTLFGNHDGKSGEDPRDPLQLLDFRLLCACRSLANEWNR